MRNATIQDVEEAQRAGALKEDVMYGFIDWKVHGKKVHEDLAWHIQDTLADNSGGVDKVVIAETNDGVIIDVALSNLRPLSKGGSAFTPRKPRPKPIKGTRPERKIIVEEWTEIKVGDVVLFLYGARGKIVGKHPDGGFNIKTRSGTMAYNMKESIYCIILPYEEKEVTYQIGDRFASDVYGPQILAQFEVNKVSLISLLDGNRFTDPVAVKAFSSITQQEFDMISGGVKFTKQSDSVK
jgi:hypothetical protein